MTANKKRVMEIINLEERGDAKTTFKTSESYKDLLKLIADENGIKVSKLIRLALNQYIENNLIKNI